MSDENSHSEHEEDFLEEEEMVAQQEKMKSLEARMSQRVAVSAEVVNEILKPKRKSESKPTDLFHKLLKLLEKSFIFKTIDVEDQAIVINNMVQRDFQQGDPVITQGDDGNEMQLVETGELDCSKLFKEGEQPKQLKTQKPGEVFGELALMYNAPRAATIVAKTASRCWALDRPTFAQYVKDANIRRRENLLSFINTVDILAELNNNEREKLADLFNKEMFSDGQTIISQGDDGDRFYILKEGKATAVKDGKQVKEYAVGDYFGELALIKNQKRAATVTSVGKSIVLNLDRKAFMRVLGPLEAILKRNMEHYNKINIE